MPFSVRVRRLLAARPRMTALGVIVVLSIALTARLGIGVITSQGDSEDARHYVAAGISLARNGFFGYDIDDGPNMYREPLTSWTIAAQALVDPRLRGLDFEDIDRPGPAARAVKQQNLLWAVLLLIGTGALALGVQGGTGRRETLVAVAAVLLTHVGFLEWSDVTDRSLSELAAGAILVWAAVFALRLIDRPTGRVAVVLGVLLGLLALTKASLLYVALVFLPILGFLMWRRRIVSGRDALRHVLIALVGLALICTPWMARNQAQFGTFGISDRGGLAIWFRVTWNDATAEELRGAWVYFSPLPLQPPAAELLGVDLSDFEGDGSLRRVARFAPTDEEEGRSFYRLARRDRAQLTAELRDAGLPRWQAAHQADRELMSRGVEALLADPMRFLRTFPVFLWRGTWSMLYSNLVPSALLGPLNLGGMALLVAALARSVIGMRPRMFAVVGVPGGMVMFYALLSHFEPRQSRPAAAVMILLCVLAGDRLLRWSQQRWGTDVSR
jgi:hypothetical protein